MTEYYKPSHFNNLRKKLSEAAKIALRKTSSEGQIERLMTIVRAKDNAIKQSARLYKQIINQKSTKHNKDLALEVINKSVDDILKATTADGVNQIVVLRNMKIKIFMEM